MGIAQAIPLLLLENNQITHIKSEWNYAWVMVVIISKLAMIFSPNHRLAPIWITPQYHALHRPYPRTLLVPLSWPIR